MIENSTIPFDTQECTSRVISLPISGIELRRLFIEIRGLQSGVLDAAGVDISLRQLHGLEKAEFEFTGAAENIDAAISHVRGYLQLLAA